MQHPSSRAPFVLAIVALSSFALHCSSEDTPPPSGTSGSSTTAGTGGGAAGSFATGGGGSGGQATTAGTTSNPTAGTGAGGLAGGSGGGGAGTAGSVAVGGGGAGGASGGSGGAPAGGSGGSGGGSAVTFAEVKALITQSCKGSDCHDPGSMFHMDWVTESTLYDNLTKPIPNNRPAQHCKGTTPVVPGNAEGSLLYKLLNGKAMCQNGNMMEEIERMPDDCPGERPCLTAEQIKLIGDWINQGAKM